MCSGSAVPLWESRLTRGSHVLLFFLGGGLLSPATRERPGHRGPVMVCWGGGVLGRGGRVTCLCVHGAALGSYLPLGASDLTLEAGRGGVVLLWRGGAVFYQVHKVQIQRRSCSVPTDSFGEIQFCVASLFSVRSDLLCVRTKPNHCVLTCSIWTL